MQKIDLKKELKHLYNPSKSEISIVNVPNMNFLMIDGKGDPNTSQQYKEAVEALFTTAYALKFAIKKSNIAIDYGVMPLEGLWWTEPMESFSLDDKNSWLWKMMIMQPEWITESLVEDIIPQVTKKKNLPAIQQIRFQSFSEGSAAQILYIGPYKDEHPTIQKIHKFIEDKGHNLSGKHHEIYLSDPRKTASEKVKTIIRQPFK